MLFYVMTGLAGQRRAADPDGSLLVTVYQAGSEAIRAELRRELAGAGDIDLVRVVASQRDRALSVAERGYLYDQLARRRDWAGLWSVVKDLTLAEAVAAMRLFGDGWRPANDSGRALFGQLTAASPAAIAGARDALTEAQAIRIPVDGLVRAGTISPDGRRVALWLDHWPFGQVVKVYTLPGGELAERYELAGACVSLAYTADALLIADSRTPLGPARLRRCLAGRAQDLPGDPGWRVVSLAPRFAGPGRADGFAVLTGKLLLLCDRAGKHTATVPLTELLDSGFGWRIPFRRLAGRSWKQLASEPGGRLAVAGDGFLVVFLELASGAPRPLAHGLLPPYVNGICFCGQDRVAASSVHSVRVQPVERGMTYPGAPDGPDVPIGGARHPVPLPARGEIAVLGRDRQVHYISTDAHALATEPGALATEPGELADRTGSCLFGTADGCFHALGGDGFVLVAPAGARELAALTDAPQARWRAADLGAVRDATPVFGFCPEARILEKLLLVSFEDRFGTDLAIGRTQLAADDDIGLSDG